MNSKNRVSPLKVIVTVCVVLVGVGIGWVFHTHKDSHEDRPVVSLTEIEQRPPFEATVDYLVIDKVPDTNSALKDFVIIGVQTKSGEKFCLGLPQSESYMLAGFAHTLQKGKVYEFPREWLDYKAKNDK